MDNLEDGYVYQFARSNNSYFAACASGMFQSEDGGSTWRGAYDSLQSSSALQTFSVAAKEGRDGVSHLYAGLNGALLHSQDNANTWERLPLPSPEPIISSIVLSPDFAQDGSMFVGSIGAGILLYSAYGADLLMWNFGLLDHEVLCLGISPNLMEDKTVFAGVSTGLFKSETRGKSWNEVDLPFGYEPVISMAISPDYEKDETLFIGAEERGLYRSSNGGLQWNQVVVNSTIAPVNQILINPKLQDFQEILVLLGDELYLSEDGGTTWGQWRSEELPNKGVTAFSVQEDSNGIPQLLVGLSGGEIRVISNG